MNKEVKVYLKRAEEQGIIPNFYLSEPYLRLTKSKGVIREGWVWVECEGWVLFPPLDLDLTLRYKYPKIKNVWSDFENLIPKETTMSEFLDWEYIFHPWEFLRIEGGKWETFRKNVRKWPRNNGGWEYTEREDERAAMSLLGWWFARKAESIQDASLILKYIGGKHEGVHKKYLYTEEGKLVAINVWDENWFYINYRFCIIDKEQPHLDEFARYLFYTDPIIQSTKKFVNDGGVLGNAGLEKFKDKLNPVSKREVHSWIYNK